MPEEVRVLLYEEGVAQGRGADVLGEEVSRPWRRLL